MVRREIWGLGSYSRGKSLEGAEVDLASSPSRPPSGAVGTRLAAFQRGPKGFRDPRKEIGRENLRGFATQFVSIRYL